MIGGNRPEEFERPRVDAEYLRVLRRRRHLRPKHLTPSLLLRDQQCGSPGCPRYIRNPCGAAHVMPAPLRIDATESAAHGRQSPTQRRRNRASAGVGRAAAIAFARRGDNIGLIARGEEGLEGAREDVVAAGGRAVVLPADVSDAAAVQAAADTAGRELGPLDVWVNAAMVTVFAPLSQLASTMRRTSRCGCNSGRSCGPPVTGIKSVTRNSPRSVVKVVSSTVVSST